MAELTGPASSQPQPEEMHWAISYLREDLQDIRNELRFEIRDDLRGLHARIDGTNARLDSQFRWLMTSMIGMTGLLAALIKL